MYGLLVPAGVDPATVEVLERFGEYLTAALEVDVSEDELARTVGDFLRHEMPVGATPLQPARGRTRARRKA